MIRAALVATLTMALAATAARASDCRLALLLAMDVSSSVDPYEDALQRNGLANALLSPQVRSAFFAAPSPVALAIFEWSGTSHQTVIVDWTVIDRPAALLAVAETVTSTPRSANQFSTAIGHALGFAHDMFRRAPDCQDFTLDVSGDGPNNDGYHTGVAYGRFPFEGVTVNALAIETTGTKGASLTAVPGDMERYYRERLIRGPDAFVEVADGFDDFERAMRRKLERELGVAILGRLSPAAKRRP